MEDKYNLQRFIKEQQRDYSTAYVEISQGRKRSHWMWWIFPQIEGLGMTATSHKYSIKSIEEAIAFLAHPYLGKNIREISAELFKLSTDDASHVMGYPDDLKLRSSMTLFAEAASDEEVFQKVPDSFYKLLETISGRIGGSIVEVGDMQYKIKNDEYDFVYQWDSLFGIVIIYPKEISSVQATAVLKKYMEDF